MDTRTEEEKNQAEQFRIDFIKSMDTNTSISRLKKDMILRREKKLLDIELRHNKGK